VEDNEEAQSKTTEDLVVVLVSALAVLARRQVRGRRSFVRYSWCFDLLTRPKCVRDIFDLYSLCVVSVVVVRDRQDPCHFLSLTRSSPLHPPPPPLPLHPKTPFPTSASLNLTQTTHI